MKRDLLTAAALLAAGFAVSVWITPALAAESERWGTSPPYSVVTISPEPGAVAKVVYDNQLSRSTIVVTATLTLGEISVIAEVTQGKGLRPDILRVFPPVGYVALPEEVTVDEYESGTVIIYAVPGV